MDIVIILDQVNEDLGLFYGQFDWFVTSTQQLTSLIFQGFDLKNQKIIFKCTTHALVK